MFPFSRNENPKTIPEVGNSEPAPPEISLENAIAKDVRNKALLAVALMEEAGISPGETFNVCIKPEATELGAVAIRTAIATAPSPHQNLPLLIDISEDSIATFQYV